MAHRRSLPNNYVVAVDNCTRIHDAVKVEFVVVAIPTSLRLRKVWLPKRLILFYLVSVGSEESRSKETSID